MKKHYKLSLMALALIMALPVVIHAEEGSDDSYNETSAPKESLRPLPPEKRPGAIPAIIRTKLQEQFDDRAQNLKNNKDLRNATLEQRLASSTPEEREKIINALKERVGSSTAPFIRKEARVASSSEMSKKDRPDGAPSLLGIFHGRKQNIVRQLNKAIENLSQIRERINARLQKEISNGKDMTEASGLLVIADTKIETAKQAVQKLSNFASDIKDEQSNASGTPLVNIDEAKTLAQTATQSTKDAKESLNKVVRSIAHALGLDKDRDEKQASTTTQ